MEQEKQIHEEPLQSYLTDDQFISYLNRNNILIDRTDNLTRFCKNNGIPWIKVKREGSAGATPHFYFKASESKLEKIRENLGNTNNSLLGREMLEKKKTQILKLFDNAPLTEKYNKKLDELPKTGEAGFTSGIKKQRAAIVKEKNENCVSRTSIAEEVSRKLNCVCNRKYVRKILEEHRSSQLDKKLLKVE